MPNILPACPSSLLVVFFLLVRLLVSFTSSVCKRFIAWSPHMVVLTVSALSRLWVCNASMDPLLTCARLWTLLQSPLQIFNCLILSLALSLLLLLSSDVPHSVVIKFCLVLSWRCSGLFLFCPSLLYFPSAVAAVVFATADIVIVVATVTATGAANAGLVQCCQLHAICWLLLVADSCWLLLLATSCCRLVAGDFSMTKKHHLGSEVCVAYHQIEREVFDAKDLSQNWATHICISLCMYVCMHACMHVTHADTNVWLYECMTVCMTV